MLTGLTVRDEHRPPPPSGPLVLLGDTAIVPGLRVLLLFSEETPAHPSPDPDFQPITHPSVLVGAFQSHCTEKTEATRREASHPLVTRPPTPRHSGIYTQFPAFLPVTEMICLHSQQRPALLGSWLLFFPPAEHYSPTMVIFPYCPPRCPTVPSQPLAPGPLPPAYGYGPSSHLMLYPSSWAHHQPLNASPPNPNVEVYPLK